MLRRIAIGAGATAGLLVTVLLTTALDNGGADAIASRFRGLLNAALTISALVAYTAALAEQIRRRDDQLREQVVDAVHEEIAGAVADAYRTAAVMTAGTTPLRSVARD